MLPNSYTYTMQYNIRLKASPWPGLQYGDVTDLGDPLVELPINTVIRDERVLSNEGIGLCVARSAEEHHPASAWSVRMQAERDHAKRRSNERTAEGHTYDRPTDHERMRPTDQTTTRTTDGANAAFRTRRGINRLLERDQRKRKRKHEDRATEEKRLKKRRDDRRMVLLRAPARRLACRRRRLCSRSSPCVPPLSAPQPVVPLKFRWFLQVAKTLGQIPQTNMHSNTPRAVRAISQHTTQVPIRDAT